MQQESYELFQYSTVQEIVEVLDAELQTRNESPFWTQKVVPFSRAILSVLVPLRDEKMLFNPEGVAVDELTPELFFKWSDFVSLKSLAFTIQKSNEAGELLRTKVDSSTCHRYKSIDLTYLGEYLSQNSVDMEKESLDFPISSYNLHQGVSNVIKSLL
ncbi:MAG: hypothetical protein U9Q29_08795 [Campylobacterota bacterium]|nr:hypothetical protein [Campylobacterota bacterium]